MPANVKDVRLTFSGGVGELIYEHIAGKQWPAETCFGDLGIDLARKIVSSPAFAPHLHDAAPEAGGRATVYGLLRYATEISGSTLFLPRETVLPLTDLPIFGRLGAAANDDRIRSLLELVRHSVRGGAVQLILGAHDASIVRSLGERICKSLRETAFPPDRPLVFLLQENVGKVMGSYVTAWGTLPVQVVVIDEVPIRNAQYVHIGTARDGSVPVSFYGLNDQGDA
jgi:ethanolamine utilization protein EutA